MKIIYAALLLFILEPIAHATFQEEHVYTGDAVQYTKSSEFFHCNHCPSLSHKTKKIPMESKKEIIKTEKISQKINKTQINKQPIPKAAKPVYQYTKVFIYFDFDKAVIKESERGKTLQMKGTPVSVTGYTDSTGPMARNDVLSKERAQAVADLMKTLKGIKLPSKVVQGKGLCCYSETNKTAVGRAKNRRAEILLKTEIHPAKSEPDRSTAPEEL